MNVLAEANESARDLLLRACSIGACLSETLSIQFDADLQLSVDGREGLVAILRLQEALISEGLCMIESSGGNLDKKPEHVRPDGGAA